MCDLGDDVVNSLLERSFVTLEDAEKEEILTRGRPIPQLALTQQDKRPRQAFVRNFKTDWYHNYKWLCGSSSRQRLFCWPCLLLAKARNIAWVTQGVIDLKNLYANVKNHESSKEHLTSSLNLKRLEADIKNKKFSQAEIGIFSKLNDDVKKNHKLLIYLIDVTCYLVNQALVKNGAFSSYNFRQTLDLIIKGDSTTQEHLKKHQAILDSIKNDLICSIADCVMEVIRDEIEEAQFFSVLVGDGGDVYERPQCVISLRFVDNFGEIKERFLGFYDVNEDRTEDAMYSLITTVLSPLDYKAKLVSQSYDGASVLVSSLYSLQKKIKDDAPKALLTHSNDQCLNLALQDGSKYIKNCRIFFGITKSMSKFFRESSKRFLAFNALVERKNPSLWFSLAKIVQLIDSEWENLQVVFRNIIEDGSSTVDSISGAERFLKIMNGVEFSFLTIVYKNIFVVTDFLSDLLQENTLNIDCCRVNVSSATDRIHLLRNEDTFDDLFDKATSRISYDLQGSLTKRPRSFDGINGNEKGSLRVLFYEIIDNVLTQFKVRFVDLPQMLFFDLADLSKFKYFSDNFPKDLVRKFFSSYEDIFDTQRLIHELGVIYNDKEFEKLNLGSLLKYVVVNDLRGIFSEAHKLFVLIATIPVVGVPSGSVFSCLKDTKLCGSVVTGELFSPLAFLSVEKHLLRTLRESEHFDSKVIQKFSEKNQLLDLVYRK